jgi:hypothetical protein
MDELGNVESGDQLYANLPAGDPRGSSSGRGGGGGAGGGGGGGAVDDVDIARGYAVPADALWPVTHASYHPSLVAARSFVRSRVIAMWPLQHRLYCNSCNGLGCGCSVRPSAA